MKAFSHVGKEPFFNWLKQVNKQQKIVSMAKLSWKPDFKFKEFSREATCKLDAFRVLSSIQDIHQCQAYYPCQACTDNTLHYLCYMPERKRKHNLGLGFILHNFGLHANSPVC